MFKESHLEIVRTHGSKLGRVLMGLLFFISGLLMLTVQGPEAVGGYFASLGIPMAALMAWVVIIVKIVAGGLIIVGQKNGWFDFGFYTVVLYIQLVCYLLALVGWYFENRKLRFKLLFVPYYFASINYAAIRGIFRYFKGKQSVNWEKSKRA